MSVSECLLIYFQFFLIWKNRHLALGEGEGQFGPLTKAEITWQKVSIMIMDRQITYPGL